jgi:hypothetical protein
MTRNRGRLSGSLMRRVGNLRVLNANRSGGSSQLVSRIIRMWTFTFLARGGRVAVRDFAKIGFVDVLDIGKHDESMRVWRGENRQSPEKTFPQKEIIQRDASLLLRHREEKISFCRSSFCFTAFSSWQIFFLQHNGGPEFEAFFTTSHVGAALTGGYWASGGMRTGTVGGGRSAIGTQKQYNRCKQGAGKAGGHRPPGSQSKRSDMQRRLNHSNQSLGVNMSGEVPECVVGELRRSSNSTAGESE